MNSNNKNGNTSHFTFIRNSVALVIFFATVLVGSAVTQALNVAVAGPFDLSANRAFADEDSGAEGDANATDTTIESPTDVEEDNSNNIEQASSETEAIDFTEENNASSENSDSDQNSEEPNNNDAAAVEYVIDELKTEQNNYNPGDAIRIEGTVNIVSENNQDYVILSVTDPQDQKVADDKELEVSESDGQSGSFEFEFTLSDDARVGEYEITASYVSSEQEITKFEVIEAVDPTNTEADDSNNENNGAEEEESISVDSSDPEENSNNDIVETQLDQGTQQEQQQEEEEESLLEVEEEEAVVKTADGDINQSENSNNDSRSSSDDDNITTAETEPIITPTIEPFIWTDKDDYSPGDTVVISGSGFSSESTITLKITHPDYGLVTWTSQSNTDGTFETTYRLDAYAEWYTVTAIDQDSNQASVVFHDTPKVGSIIIGTQSPSPVTAGSSASYTITVNRGTGSGSSGSFTASLSITSTLPSGVTASFASSLLSFSSTDTSKSTTLTLSTSGSTSPGPHSFTVKAMRPDATADSASNTGSLSVSAPADSIAPATTASPTGGLYNSDQSVTLTANEPAIIYYTIDGSTPTISSTSGTSPVSGISITTTTVLKFFAKDSAGNTESVKSVTYTIDKNEPIITVPDNILAEATDSSGVIVEFDSPTSDDGSAVSCDYESGNTFPIGITIVECEATDSAGNTGAASFTITVEDKTAPSIVVPDSIIVEAESADGATVTYSASATDAVDGEVTLDCQPVSGSVFGLGETTVTCEATDSTGNTDSTTFTITVQDTTAPTLTLPDNIVAEATSSSGATISFIVTAEDAVDSAENLSIICNPESESLFSLGETTVECEAIDSQGNSATGSFTITVEDTSAPIITIPTGTTVEATSADGAIVEFTTTAEDGVDGTVDVECTPASGATFAMGETIVECQSTDLAGNMATASFTITVQDTTSPEITVPAGAVIEAASAAGATVEYSVSASDAVDGDLSSLVECDPASGSTFPIGLTTVTCEITDAAGNIASDTFTVTVQDATAPVVTAPADITVEATGTLTTIENLGVPSASDAVDGSTPVTNDAPSSFPIGITTVTYSSTDNAGNTGTATQIVTVADTTAPTLTVPDDIVVEATSASGAVVSFEISVSDLVEGEDLEFSCDYESGTTFSLGETTVECEATDSQGNTGVASFAITVQDTTAPTITVPLDITVSPTSASGAVVTYSTATATDEVDTSVSVACAPASGSTFAIGMTTVSCSATDDSGNTASKAFKVTVTPFTSNGFFKPIDMGATINTAKGGSTIPLKFEAFAGTTEMTDTAVIKSYTQQKISCVSGPIDAVGTLSMTGNTGLRYDLTSGQFVANWKTPNQPNTCWKVTITLQGDNTISALFKLK